MCFCIKNNIGPRVKICRLIGTCTWCFKPFEGGGPGRFLILCCVVFFFFYCQEFYVESLFFSCLFSPV